MRTQLLQALMADDSLACEACANMKAGHGVDCLCLCIPHELLVSGRVPAEPMERASWRAWEP